MEATELMVGDIALVANTSTKITDSDLAVMLAFKDKDFHIESIPLTPEILEKNGFEKQNDFIWLISENEGRKIIMYDTFSNYLHIVYAVSPLCELKAKINYLHELQHALMLCKIDKKIEI